MAASKVPANPQGLLAERMKEAVKIAGVNTTSTSSSSKSSKEEVPAAVADVEHTNLSQRYLQQLTSDLAKRLETDPDFDPSKHPETQKYINNNNNKKK